MFRCCEKDGIELAAASADLAGLVTRLGGIEPILRGAAYSRTRAVDASFASEVSVSSKLFNFPVEAVQRGRDHGAKSSWTQWFFSFKYTSWFFMFLRCFMRLLFFIADDATLSLPFKIMD